MPSDKASLQVLITMEESLVYLERKRVIVEPIKWKLSVILIALKVKTGSPCLRLALVLASLAERSCQQVASPAFFYRLSERHAVNPVSVLDLCLAGMTHTIPMPPANLL